ncbi:uncharacterized protein LOC116200823 [Punica granatum]|uniref:Uncharacterized protein n=2 Tax=Punica granatum TaxID=22663 RepID=A0A218XB67_PUNGR|nr:uncharacterized protein LOC116200823 [Punica granatum]OWM81592.1 hypothetical protein CDL15_Pgr007630 [Punica granatum]PKI40995.1 hypothetical protein CRG98_038523 [Punica granatum]
MAYRRRQGIARSSTFKEEIHYPPHEDCFTSSNHSSSSSSSSLAAQAIRASAAHRESSLSSAYGDSAVGYRNRDSDALRSKSFAAYGGDSSVDSDSKSGFWGVLARKAKAILEDENASQQFENPTGMKPQMYDSPQDGQQPYPLSESLRRVDNPSIRKRLDQITSSLNQIGDTFEKAFEEGRTIVESKTQDIIHETRKLQSRRKGTPETPNDSPGANSPWHPLQPQNQTNHENQLKASRDVAMATAAKAKLLLRELKTVKADLAFAKLRCSQLEEENKVLREGKEKGGNAADDDLIRLQLETLLAEKARLAHENETYARENRFLREIVEYHQLTMQDVVYLDEGIEEVTEVYPIPSVSSIFSMSPSSPKSPPSPVMLPVSASGSLKSETLSILQEDEEEAKREESLENSVSSVKKEEDQRGHLGSSAKV